MADHPPAPSTLRKRPISVDTSRPGADGAASREGPRRHMPGQGAREEGEREAAGSISMASAPAMEEQPEAAAKGRELEVEVELEAGEPMSPAGRLFRETHFNCYIVAVIGLGSAVDVAGDARWAGGHLGPPPALLQPPDGKR
nr:unnamed protein product [Digitaria exilis]